MQQSEKYGYHLVNNVWLSRVAFVTIAPVPLGTTQAINIVGKGGRGRANNKTTRDYLQAGLQVGENKKSGCAARHLLPDARVQPWPPTTSGSKIAKPSAAKHPVTDTNASICTQL